MGLPRRAIPLLVLVIAVGLGVGGWARAQQGCALSSGEGMALAVERRANQALVADATVTLASPAPVYLEYGNERAGWLRTPVREAAASHEIPIVRLRAESTYQVRAFAVGAERCSGAQAEASFTTGRLPTLIRQLQVQATGRPTFPLAVMDYRPPDSDNRWLLAFDQDSQVVWYYLIPREIQSAHSGLTLVQRPNGNIVYLSRAFGVEEITPDGRSVRQVPVTSPAAREIHHDLTLLPDGRVLFLGFEIRTINDPVTGKPSFKIAGDTLHLLDLDSGVEQQVWSVFDALDPGVRVSDWKGKKLYDAEDWTHANTIFLGPRGSYILSIRHLNQIISLSPDFSTVEWRLGGPGSSFEFPDPGDRFYAPHGVVELPDNRIIMFDNGNYRPEGEYSRALELTLDFATMTARKTWEFRPQPDVFSDRFGSTIRLPNGNTLVGFGWRDDPDDPIPLYEVRPDSSVEWELILGLDGARTIRFRAYPYQTLAGETPIQ